DDSGARRPFRLLHWQCWLGDEVPETSRWEPKTEVVYATDFELPADCWLRQARLPRATRVSVTGNKWPALHMKAWDVARRETERFLYYDGLVPAPNYIHCARLDDNSVTLHNRASISIGAVFVIDRRDPGTVGYAYVGDERPLSPGASLKVVLKQ